MSEPWQKRVRSQCVESLKDICSVITRARRVLRSSRRLEGTLFPNTAALSLSDDCRGGRVDAAVRGRAERAVRVSAESARLAKGDTENTRGSVLRRLFTS